MRDYFTFISKTIDSIERGKYHEVSLSWCADKIAWLAKWHKLPKNKIEYLTNRVTELFEQGFYD